MKWSELFSTLLGLKDVDVPESFVQNGGAQLPPSQFSGTSVADAGDAKKDLQPPSTIGNGATPEVTVNPEISKEFDALNARIKELEEANKQLVMQGSIPQTPQLTDEELIYNLCVGRTYGEQNDTANLNAAKSGHSSI